MREIKTIPSSHLAQAWDLVKRTFDIFEAPEFSEVGNEAFYTYMKEVEERMKTGNEDIVVWGCFEDEVLCGVCTLLQDHVGMLFVDEAYHQKHIAKDLLEEAKHHCLQNGYDILTINAFPYAVDIYHHMGFMDSGPKQMKYEMVFTPMCFKLI